MSEPEILQSQKPHQVSIPEGSNMAVAKTATQQDPSVHKVYKPGGGEAIEPVVPDEFVSDAPKALTDLPDKFVSAPEAERSGLVKAPVSPPIGDTVRVLAPEVQEPERSTPLIPAAAASSSTVSPAPAQASAIAADSNISAAPVLATDMPEMDFPARVVHLRIENEQLRSRLDQMDAES